MLHSFGLILSRRSILHVLERFSKHAKSHFMRWQSSGKAGNVITTSFKQSIWPFTLLALRATNFPWFSNHIYIGQENLRRLCLTRWLTNRGWLHWGLGHPNLLQTLLNHILPSNIFFHLKKNPEFVNKGSRTNKVLQKIPFCCSHFYFLCQSFTTKAYEIIDHVSIVHSSIKCDCLLTR